MTVLLTWSRIVATVALGSSDSWGGSNCLRALRTSQAARAAKVKNCSPGFVAIAKKCLNKEIKVNNQKNN